MQSRPARRGRTRVVLKRMGAREILGPRTRVVPEGLSRVRVDSTVGLTGTPLLRQATNLFDAGSGTQHYHCYGVACGWPVVADMWGFWKLARPNRTVLA